MSFLKLQNISKIYVEKVVSVGLSKINLEFNLGEFVAITGKSGSGKTTLLNVISGIDSYEEGELYINNSPTSHFTQKEFEDYREQYISFIFQDYNIIDSFTVLENVELSLMHIKNLKERRNKALELIEKVGLKSHIHHKGSKLSGGQKQRTVIARALAKNSPVILADEPTGNLDSTTSKQIIKLLKEISKDKLVIVVTHNYEDFKDYATRHIRIYDGKIVEDEALCDYSKTTYEEQIINKSKKSDFLNSLLLGFIKFKSKPKLSLILSLIFTIAVLGSFFVTSLFKESYNKIKLENAFQYINGRVIISKKDGVISDEILEEIKIKTNASYYIRYDDFIDINKDKKNYYLVYTNKKFNVDYGRMPLNDNEVILEVPICDKPNIKSIINNSTINKYFDIVGVKFTNDNNKRIKFYCSNELAQKIGFYYDYNDISGIIYFSGSNSYAAKLSDVLVSNSISKNTIIIPKTIYEEYYLSCSKEESDIRISVKDNLYGEIDLDINELNIVCGNTNDDNCYISNELLDTEYKNLVLKNYNQASMFYKNNKEAKKALKILAQYDLYTCLSNEKTKNTESLETIFNIVSLILVWVIEILFLGLFIYLCSYKLILTTKQDIGIYRSMGIKNNCIKKSIFFNLIFNTIIPFIILVILTSIIYNDPYLNDSFCYLYWYEYGFIIFGLLLIILYLTKKFNHKLFLESVRKNLKGVE